jgi:dTDP-4-dehydrorhamnose reductase
MVASPNNPEALLATEEELEEALSRPTPGVVEDLTHLRGDLVILGVGGKMGPTLARMARRALDQSGSRRAVIGAARFTDARARQALEACGVRTHPCDLLRREDVDRLPDAGAVIFMAGMKFGTTGAEAATWAVNTYLPGLAAERYRGVPTVVFSTGNVYPLVPVSSGGATEETPTAPVGEYAQSALGRERVYEHFSREHGTLCTVYRLNYAVELRYGVLLDVARKVHAGVPVDLRMGYANVIWQGDANAAALRCIDKAQCPPLVLNVTGHETLSIRQAAARFGERFGRAPVFQGKEEETALLSNASKARSLFGPPTVPVDRVIDWIAHWVTAGGRTLGKPTHFETRDGKF